MTDPNVENRPCSVEEVLETLGISPTQTARTLGRNGVLAGREKLLLTLRTQLDDLIGQRPSSRIVWLTAEKGAGKTRLLQEIKWEAQLRARVFEVNCHAGSAVHDALSLATGSPLSRQSIDAIVQAHEQLEAEALPTVFVIDDADRLSEEQATALTVLLRSIRSTSSSLAVVSSTQPPGETLEAISLSLEPLDLEALHAWIGQSLPDNAIQTIHLLSEGLPASVRYLLDRLELDDLSIEKLLVSGPQFPTSSYRIEKAHALSLEAKRLLGMLIIRGEGLSREQLESFGISLQAANELVKASLAESEPFGWKLRRLGEADSLLCVVGDDVVRDLHRQAALVLDRSEAQTETKASERNARAVYHLAHAGDWQEARDRLMDMQHLFDGAPRSWHRAASAVLRGQTDPELELLMARLEQQVGDGQRAWTRLWTLSQTASKPQLLRIKEELATCATALGRLDDAIVWFEAARADAEKPDQHAALSFQLARALTRKGHYRDALHVCEKSLQDVQTEELRSDLLEAAAVARSYLGDAQGARNLFERTASDDRKDDNPRRRVRSLGSRALVDYRAGHLEAAAQGYSLALQHAQTHGLLDMVATAALNLGTLCHQQGNWAAAVKSYHQGMRMAVALGQSGTETVLRFNLAKLYSDVGQFERAKTMAEQCLMACRRAAQPLMEAAAQTVLGEVATAQRDFERAKIAFQTALTAYETQESQRECAEILLQLADVALLQTDLDDATKLLQRARSCLVDLDARDVQIRAELIQSRLDLASGKGDQALATAERVVPQAESLGQNELLAEAHWLLASVWQQQGSRWLADRSRDHARETWEKAAARLPDTLRESFWNHPRRALVLRPSNGPFRDHGSRREKKLELLIDINKRLNSSLDFREVLTRAMDGAIELTGAERGFVLLANSPDPSPLDDESDSRQPPSAQRLHVAIARNLDGQRLGKSHVKFSRAIAEKVLRDAKPVITADARDDHRFRSHQSVHAMQLLSVACVPVMSSSGVLGALYLDNRFRRDSFDMEDVDLLMALSDQVALALENASLLRELMQRNEQLDAQRKRVEALARGQAEEIGRLTEAVRAAESSRKARVTYRNIIGSSSALQAVFEVLDRVKDVDLPVLVQGESGTGKELIARALHAHGSRRDGPWVAVNCGAVPETLLESELFGHQKGAFTGADRDREGLIVKANGGVLFLDELGELPWTMQVKLLRVLQEREVRPLGATHPISVDFRLVCATNRVLVDEVRKGTFREDLYYRVSVIELTVPPLRERLEDIAELAAAFLNTAAERTKKSPLRLSSGALRKLMSYSWPGNVRQLENILLRASLLADGHVLRAQDIALPDPIGSETTFSREQFARDEKQRIAEALSQQKWNVASVARQLGIPRPSLYRKLKRYGLLRGSE